MGKGKEGLMNREVGSGAGKGMKGDGGHDVGKAGYHKSAFGGVEKENYRINDAYASKDESPSRSDSSSIHDIAHHSVTGELYSGEPGRHGHLGKSGK